MRCNVIPGQCQSCPRNYVKRLTHLLRSCVIRFTFQLSGIDGMSGQTAIEEVGIMKADSSGVEY